MIETGVGALLCVSHRDPVRKAIHGHTYLVKAWFAFEEPRDAVVLQKHLETVLTAWDHQTLPDDCSRAEDLLPKIKALLDSRCVEVEMERALERIYARVRT